MNKSRAWKYSKLKFLKRVYIPICIISKILEILEILDILEIVF